MLSDLNIPLISIKESRVESSAIQRQRAILSELDTEFDVSADKTFADLVHFRPRSEQPFHRWFRYREGYDPELVRRAIQGLEIPCNHILDPFCGAGSTLLAGRGLGIPSTGIDVNPIVTTVAQAKTRNYSSTDIKNIETAVDSILHMHSALPRADSPAVSILDKLFRPDVLDALLTARVIVQSQHDDNIRDFLMVGWLAILEAVSNVFKEGNGIKYKNRKRTSTGYVTIPWEELALFGDDGWTLVRDRLASQYRRMLLDLVPNDTAPVPTIIEDSAINAIKEIDANSISLCIFSPPYCNNFNYMKIFKVELWMSGIVQSYSDMRELSQKALRSHVEMRIDLPAQTSLPSELEDLIGLIDQSQLWNAKIPAAVVAYFVDMQFILEGIWRSLEPGGECQIVVGNSAYGGVVIPTDVLLARIGQDIGFTVDRVVVARHLTTSSQQRTILQDLLGFLRESIVVLRKV